MIDHLNQTESEVAAAGKSCGVSGAARLFSALALAMCCVPIGAAGLSEKPALEIAQLLRPAREAGEEPAPNPSDSAEDAPAADDTPASNATPTSDESAPSGKSDNSFVFAGDLARTLRKIDPTTKVDWDGKKLRIKAAGQEFAVFPTGSDMVINGEVQSGMPPLKIRNGEIYVPQEVVTRIGTSLEKKATDAGTTTTIATPTPSPSPSPSPTATPEVSPTPATTPMSILPDMTPVVESSPSTASTSILPATTPAPTPSATPSPTPAAQPVATPFPQASPTPTPTPTPTPRPTPVPKADAEKTPRPTQLAATTEAFKAALRDKISMSSSQAKIYTNKQLDDRAAQRSIQKVLIHPDESGIEKSDEYGKQSAKISLEVAQRVKAQLEAAGIQAELTHTSADQGTPMGDLMEAVTNSDAQAFIIVSVGYSTQFKDLGGYRLFYMNDSVDFHSLEPKTFDASEAVPSEYNYKSFQNESKVLVSSLKNSVSNAVENRTPVGTNPVPDYLLRRAPMASAAVEIGYLSNPFDARRLVNATDQDAMAAAIAEGIRNFGTQLSQGQVTAKLTEANP